MAAGQRSWFYRVCVSAWKEVRGRLRQGDYVGTRGPVPYN